MSARKIIWKKRPDVEDFKGAANYLHLLYSPAKTRRLIHALRLAPPILMAAKDLLRASELALLPKNDPHVDSDLKRISKRKPLAPVLLIRGDGRRGLPLTIADGYHRICAICHHDESEPIPCRLIP